MKFEPVPEGVRVAVYNAMGGFGPYTVREIEELFKMYGFTEAAADVADVGGVRRSVAEAFQRRINWADREQRRRYLMLVEDVLENYPDVDGKRAPEAKKVRRALELAGAEKVQTSAVSASTADDLWPVGSMRIFISHLANRKTEVHELAEVLRAVGFACFVAHDQIHPSRSWQLEIERALRSCDLLIAYVTPGFANSQWTDQEVGWALGRDLVVIPVSVEGEMPSGFLGTYQAVVRGSNQGARALGRAIYDAIIDAVFRRQRPGAEAIRSRLASQIVDRFCRVSSFARARTRFEFLERIPSSEWTPETREMVERALVENDQLADAFLDDREHTPLSDAVRKLTGQA